MPRYRLIIEYDGTPFVGWQQQGDQPSVQGALARAIEGATQQTVTVNGAGRTDAGVHARGQVAHIDLETGWQGWKLRDAINAHLRPAPVAVLKAEEVDQTFDARFSAIRRHYEYHIINRRADLTLERARAWHIRPALDVEAMQKAARHLVGHHDFSTFRAAECQARSPLRTMERLELHQHGERIVLHASARSFLHHQIRSIMGSLVEVGKGKQPPEWMKTILNARDRTACGPTAPACGLYFMQVEYAEPQHNHPDLKWA